MSQLARPTFDPMHTGCSRERGWEIAPGENTLIWNNPEPEATKWPLTDSQIELLCEIEEHDSTTLTGDKGRDLERLLSGGTSSRWRVALGRPTGSPARVMRRIE